MTFLGDKTLFHVMDDVPPGSSTSSALIVAGATAQRMAQEQQQHIVVTALARIQGVADPQQEGWLFSYETAYSGLDAPRVILDSVEC